MMVAPPEENTLGHSTEATRQEALIGVPLGAAGANSWELNFAVWSKDKND